MLNYSWKASPNWWGRQEFNATFSIGFGNGLCQCHLLYVYFSHYFSYYFFFCLRLLFFLLCHYYFNYYFNFFWLCQGFASEFTEAGRRQFSSYALSNDCQVSLGASEASWSTGKLALSSQVNIWSWTTTIIRIFLFYLLFWMFDQDWAACNLDLRTAGQHASNLWEVSCHHIKKKALLAGIWAQYMPFSFVLFALCHYYFILY